jgi:lipid-A-disaccharide synthase-like uncharacterized protein
MDSIKTSLEHMSTIPHELWYAATLLLGGILAWMIQKYFASLTDTLKSMGESIKKLTEIVNLHDYQINELKGNAKRAVKR